MPRYEYKVVPAPTKGLKAKGVKGAEARFAHAVQELMNGLTGYGWEYLRAETLPSIERAGLTGSTTEWRNVLVFRRVRDSDADAFAPELLPAPVAAAAGGVALGAVAAEAEGTAPDAGSQDAETEADNEPFEPITDPMEEPEIEIEIEVEEGATPPATLQEAWDNGLEEADDIAHPDHDEGIGETLEKFADTRNSERSET